MANTEHLAIASVPMQCWDKVYEEAQALKEGTIFPELNKPFYVTVGDGYLPESNAGISGASITQDNLLLQIQQVRFVLDDLRLFLDTHPQEKQALELLKSMLKKRKILLMPIISIIPVRSGPRRQRECHLRRWNFSQKGMQMCGGK